MKTFILLNTLLFLFAIQGCNRENKSEPGTNSDQKSSNALAEDTRAINGYGDVNGIKMYYEIYGQGDPLVLIHGGGSTIETSFGRIMPELSKHYRLIAVELQAHGHTSDRSADLSFEQDADDVVALLATLNITRADFLGFSNGGNTAIQIAIRHPKIAGKIIAASPLLKKNGASPQFWTFMNQAKIEQMPEKYKEAFLKITADSSRLQIMHDKCVKRMVQFKDLTDEQIKSINAPVLLINGDADVATSEHMVQMSRLIPMCKLAILPGSHGQYLGEITTLIADKPKPPIVLPILEEFLE